MRSHQQRRSKHYISLLHEGSVDSAKSQERMSSEADQCLLDLSFGFLRPEFFFLCLPFGLSQVVFLQQAPPYAEESSGPAGDARWVTSCLVRVLCAGHFHIHFVLAESSTIKASCHTWLVGGPLSSGTRTFCAQSESGHKAQAPC